MRAHAQTAISTCLHAWQWRRRREAYPVNPLCAGAYAYDYAQSLQKWRGAKAMKEVFDSLELATLCNATFDASSFAGAPAAAPPAEGGGGVVTRKGSLQAGAPTKQYQQRRLPHTSTLSSSF